MGNPETQATLGTRRRANKKTKEQQHRYELEKKMSNTEEINKNWPDIYLNDCKLWIAVLSEINTKWIAELLFTFDV